MPDNRKKSVKIIHLVGSAHFGGIERLVYDLTRAQSKHENLDVNILILKKEGKFLDKFLESGITCYFSNISSGYDFSVRKYYKIYRLLKQFDIVNLHSFNPLLSFILLLVNVRIVYTIHGVKGYGRIKKRLGFLKQWLQGIFLTKFVDFVTFNSNYSKDYWTNQYSFKKNHFAVIYNGVDFSDKKKMNSLSDELKKNVDFVIGTSSRFIKWKRVDILIRTFFEFQKQNPKSTLLLVGDGTERANLEDLTKKLKISGKVIFTGFQSNVQAYQNAMDICVFPSTTETFGLVAIETLLLGKPTLVMSDGGGIVEIIEQGFPEDISANEEDMVNRMNFYRNNKSIIECEKQKRIELALKFDINRMAKEFEHLYSKLSDNL